MGAVAIKAYLKTHWFRNKQEAEEASRIAVDYYRGRCKFNFRWFAVKSDEEGHDIITAEDFETHLKELYND